MREFLSQAFCYFAVVFGGGRRGAQPPRSSATLSHFLHPCNVRSETQPRVVVIGGGFGGLMAARRLATLPVRITLIDRSNHHTFQPLLYQVATAGLSAPEIAAPIREILARHKNIEVLLGEVTGFDLDRHLVKLPEFDLPYDYLVVAAGATHAYFGHDEWEAFAPGLMPRR